jgi:hypothetical protein
MHRREFLQRSAVTAVGLVCATTTVAAAVTRPPFAFTTGIPGFDEALGGGFQPGTVNYVLGPCSGGKTMFLGHMKLLHIQAVFESKEGCFPFVCLEDGKRLHRELRCDAGPSLLLLDDATFPIGGDPLWWPRYLDACAREHNVAIVIAAHSGRRARYAELYSPILSATAVVEITRAERSTGLVPHDIRVIKGRGKLPDGEIPWDLTLDAQLRCLYALYPAASAYLVGVNGNNRILERSDS